MASASNVRLYFNNGKTLDCLIASTAAVGTSPTVSWDGAAVSTGPTDFTPSQDCIVVDQITILGTAGQMELYNITKSQRTGRLVEQTATMNAVTVPNRPFPNIGLKAGNWYRFIQTVAQTAA